MIERVMNSNTLNAMMMDIEMFGVDAVFSDPDNSVDTD